MVPGGFTARTAAREAASMGSSGCNVGKASIRATRFFDLGILSRTSYLRDERKETQ